MAFNMMAYIDPLKSAKRVLLNIPMVPLQGRRFQPTGFPSLGAATFQSSDSTGLLVESTQSMANHLELTIWDHTRNDIKQEFDGLSHVRINRNGNFLTDTILESHRLNSPYLLEGKNKKFLEMLKRDVGAAETGPIDRKKFFETVLKYDVNSLVHGLFLAKKELAGGRLRITRALSAFVEANDIQVAASGGVKNDRVNPSGDTAKGFGNVPFARDEYTASGITLYVNLDLALIRSYRLGSDVESLLVLLSLYKIRALLDGGIRLRTACDLRILGDDTRAHIPQDWPLPPLKELESDLRAAVAKCRDRMVVETVEFNDEIKKGKTKDEPRPDDA